MTLSSYRGVGVSKYGIVNGHAYAITGVAELKNDAGEVVHKLIQIFNPWRSDTAYNGTFNDADPIWD